MSKNKLIKPFLKWVGGKTQIIDEILDKFPKNINNYHEPFIGGGSILLGILSNDDITIKGNVYAYDINPALIGVYKNIQKCKDSLFELTQKYINEYDSLSGDEINRKPKNEKEGKTSKESYYYWLRDKFNKIEDKSSIECSALFMFLNKTCFRGLYREGPNGFNVPYGHYKKTPTIITRSDIDKVSELIKNVNFKCCDFEDSFKAIKEGDFTYLDPPYAPENEKSFVKYTNNGFNIDRHKILFDLILKLKDKNISFILSNANVKLVTDTFKDYNIEEILCRRAINSKKPQSKTLEVIIT